MYRYNKPTTTSIRVNQSYAGETIEQKVNRILNNGEPIKDGAPLLYSERKNGVNPDCDIRTDRWEYAVDAQDYITRANLAKRQERHEGKIVKMDKDGKPESAHGTSPGQDDKGDIK